MLAEEQTERRILSGGIFQKSKMILAIELLLAESDPNRGGYFYHRIYLFARYFADILQDGSYLSFSNRRVVA